MPSKSLYPGVDLYIADDQSSATLVIAADADVSATNVGEIIAAIQNLKIAISQEQSATIATAFEAHRQRPERIELVIARAVAAVHGENGRVEWVRGCPHDESAGNAGASPGRIDYYNQAHYVAVNSGSLLATLRPPTPGRDGLDIYGKVLKAKSGTPATIKTDSTISINSEGNLIAQINGILRGQGVFWKIVPLFDVLAVNFSTGNIFFKGSVVVRGDVCDRFVVHASEDVTVQGVIGAGTIICGRNLHANCGMASDGRGSLLVAGDAMAGYLHNVHGVVRGKLLARKEIINCGLSVGQDLICDAGAVIGGSIAIGGSAVIGVLGSIKGTTTTLVFAADSALAELDEVLQAGSGEAGVAAFDPLRANERIRSCALRSCEYNPAKTRPVHLTIQRNLHPGVVIRTGRSRVRIDRTMRGPIHIHGDSQGGLFYRMGDSVSHPLSELSGPIRKAG